MVSTEVLGIRGLYFIACRPIEKLTVLMQQNFLWPCISTLTLNFGHIGDHYYFEAQEV